MILRKYRTEDCESIAGLFYETVHSVNAADYTPEQLDVWATGKVDLEAWDKSFREHFTIVAEETKEEKQDFGKRLLGFGDIDSTGYLDRLYVHKDHQRQGIAPRSAMNWRERFRQRRSRLTPRSRQSPFF